MSEADAGVGDGWLDRERMPFATALAHCRSGAFREGYAICQEILAREPDDIDALHLSGLIMCQAGHVEEGIKRLRRAVALNDRIPVLHYNLAEAFRGSSHFGEAAAHYEIALRLAPGFADAQAALGNCLLLQNRMAEAEAALRQATTLNPTTPEPLYHHGNTLLALKRYEEALDRFDRVLAIQPHLAPALHNRGVALLALGRYESALAAFECTLAITPDDTRAIYNRGDALLELGRHQEALADFDRALTLNPSFAEAACHRAVALLELGQPSEALAAIEQALAIAPHRAEAYAVLGNILDALTRPEEALVSYDRALVLDPNHVLALNNRGSVLLSLGRNEEAARDFTHLLAIAPRQDLVLGNQILARLNCGDWSDYDRSVDEVVARIGAGQLPALPFVLLAISGKSSVQVACARTYSTRRYPAAPSPLWRGERYTHERIRVAYLSADFREHAVAFSMAGVWEQHDRSRFETIAVSLGPTAEGAFGSRLKASFDRFSDARDRGDREIAAMLKAWQIDIAIDPMGYTAACRSGIFALRPAPIQVNFFGYPGTTGAEYMHYIIGDRTVIPEGEHAAFSEQVVYLPDSYLPTDAKRMIGETAPSRREAGLPESGFVFCSFNNTYKVTPSLFAIWMRLLREVEGSVLWLLGGDEAVVRNRREYARQHGVDPDRLVFAPRTSHENHLARHRLADLFLDTLPYNAHATAADALWVGLPVLTCCGTSFASRVAASVLGAVGLPELITDNLDDYERLAVRLARDPAALASIKARLAANRATHPLFDTARYTRHLEAAFETMWQRYQRGEPAAPFAVPPLPRA